MSPRKSLRVLKADAVRYFGSQIAITDICGVVKQAWGEWRPGEYLPEIAVLKLAERIPSFPRWLSDGKPRADIPNRHIVRSWRRFYCKTASGEHVA